MKLLNASQNNKEICEVIEAKSLWQRGRGLMFRREWPADTALWIHRCNSIHTCFMQFSIDAVFVDRDLIVRKIFTDIQPWRLVLPVWPARSVFEFAAGQDILQYFELGDRLNVGH